MFSIVKLLYTCSPLLFVPIVYGQSVANPVFQIQNWVDFTATSLASGNVSVDQIAFSQQFQSVNITNDFENANSNCGDNLICGPTRYVIDFGDACNATVNFSMLQTTNENIFAAVHNSSHKAIALITRSGNCNWAQKVTNAQTIATTIQLPLDAVLIYDSTAYANSTDEIVNVNDGSVQTPTYSNNGLPANQNVSFMPDNDLNAAALTIAVYFASNELGRNLAQNVSLASNNSLNSNAKQVWVLTPILGIIQNNSFSSMLAASKGYLSYIIGLAAVFLVGAILLRWWRLRRLREQMAQRGDLEPGIAMRNRHPKVHPLPVDILNTYPVEMYSTEKIKNNSCAICLDDFVTDKNSVRVLPCRHGFCTGCIDPWLTDKSPLCPICKHDCLPAELRQHADLVQQNPVLDSASPFTTPSAAAAAALATDDETSTHSAHSSPPPPFEENQSNASVAENSEHVHEDSTPASTATPSNPSDSKPAAT